MLSFRSIILAAAALAIVASAIPTASPSDDAGMIGDIVKRDGVGVVDAEGHLISPAPISYFARSVNDEGHTDLLEDDSDHLLIKRGQINAHTHFNTHLFYTRDGHVTGNADPLIK